MAAFRRSILALALFASFATLASAQNTTPMSCTVTPYSNAMRSEGKNELIGDLVVSCSGGTPFADDTAAPRVNFTLTLPQSITSRLASTPTTTAVASDALLLIDDPSGITPNPLGAALNGYGVSAAPTPCATLTDVGCQAFSETVGGFTVMSLDNAGGGGPDIGAANVYQGMVLGNTVTFHGVPVIPPGSTAARTFRITNVRMNATAAAAGSQSVSLAITNSSGNLSNTAGLFGGAAAFTGNLGTVQTGLSSANTKWTAATPGLTNCAALTAGYAGRISFGESFGSAFKTRQTPAATQNGAQDAGALTNLTPGAFQTESGWVPTTTGQAGGTSNLTVNTKAAGLADFGTRLKAVFTNIPSGARVFVSFTNVEGASANNVGSPNTNFVDNTNGNLKAAAGGTATSSFAALITGAETVADTTGAGTAVPVATATASATGAIPANYDYVELTVSSTGSATAIWEVLNTNPSAAETFTFTVFISQAAQGTTGNGTVNLSFAPTASTATTIPSFADTSGSGVSAFSVGGCTTILLFPYVTSAAGFETGLAVSNTTTDGIGTTAQAGACSLFVYGLNANGQAPTSNGPFSPTSTTGAAFPASGVPSGQTAQWLLSASAPGFTGYAIATCNFQFAHGFAFVFSPQLSAAMGYLPLVLQSPTGRSSGNTSEAVNF
jgi:hypothetical protein